MQSLERAFLNVVNEVGVDINRAVNSSMVAPAVQFISGLGPRKAQSILSRIRATVSGLLDLKSFIPFLSSKT